MTRTFKFLLAAAAITSSMLAGCSSSTSPGSNGGSGGGGLFVPDTVNFGSLANGQTKDTVISIFNETSSAIIITGNSLSSSQAKDTNFSHSVSIAPGYITIHIEFTSSSSSNSAMDSIRYQSAGKTYTAVMTLTANAGGTGTLIAAPNVINFGTLPVGQWHDTTIFLVNGGTAPITILSNLLNGPEGKDTNFSHPVTINDGGSPLAIHLQFNPAQAGARSVTDQINYTSAGTNSSVTITLQAQGIASSGGGGITPGPGSTFTYAFTSVDTNGVTSPVSDSTYIIVSNTLTYQGKTNVIEVQDGSGGIEYYHIESNGNISIFVDFSQLAAVASIPSQWLVIPIGSNVEQTNTLYDTSVMIPIGTTPTPMTVTLTSDGKDLGPTTVTVAGTRYSCENGSLTITLGGTATVFGFPVQVFSQGSAITIS